MSAYDYFERINEEEGAEEYRAALEGWDPIDLDALLAGGLPPAPVPVLLGAHTPDGQDPGPGLFYRAAINELHGASGTGKSFVAAKAAQEEMAAGGVVLWVDLEANVAETVMRLRALGATDERLVKSLVYVQPRNAVRAVIDSVLELVERLGVTMLVLDSLGESFAIDGINEDRDDEVGPWTRAVLRPVAEAGVLVLVIDHSTKANDNPLFPSGSKRKRASWTGAGYLIVAAPSFARDTPGWLNVKVAKDRHGTRPAGAVAVRIKVEPAPNGELWMTPYAPQDPDKDAAERALDAAIVAAVGDYLRTEARPECSQNEVMKKALKNVKASTDRKRAALDWAVGGGYLTERRQGQSRLYGWVRDVETASDDDLA